MTINWTNIYKKYKGLWVALKNDKKTVVASAKTLKEVLNKAQKKGIEHPFVTQIPRKILPFVG